MRYAAMSFRVVLIVMLAFIFLARTSMARTPSGIDITDPASTIAFNGLTISSLANTTQHSSGATCEAPGLLNPTNGDTVLPCKCFHSGHGQDRYFIIRAIEEFCERTSDLVWSGADLAGIRRVYKDFWYNKDNTIEGIRVILIKQEFWADQLDTHEQCDPKFVVDYDTCYKSLHVPVDQCDTSRENGKHGGQATSGCLLWTVDSDPEHNNEDIYSSLTMPSSVWPTPPAKL